MLIFQQHTSKNQKQVYEYEKVLQSGRQGTAPSHGGPQKQDPTSITAGEEGESIYHFEIQLLLLFPERVWRNKTVTVNKVRLLHSRLGRKKRERGQQKGSVTLNEMHWKQTDILRVLIHVVRGCSGQIYFHLVRSKNSSWAQPEREMLFFFFFYVIYDGIAGNWSGEKSQNCPWGLNDQNLSFRNFASSFFFFLQMWPQLKRAPNPFNQNIWGKDAFRDNRGRALRPGLLKSKARELISFFFCRLSVLFWEKINVVS